MGRPSTYTPELGALICERIAVGQSLRTIEAEEGMPAKTTILRWLSQDSVFRDLYVRAKEAATDAMAEELLEIADDTAAQTDRDRLRVDTRKWLLAKLQPRKYGERQTLEHEGAVGTYVLRAPEPAKDASEWLKSSGLHSPAPKPTS